LLVVADPFYAISGMAKKTKNPAAVALGRLGGQAKVPKGLSMLSEERRKEIATKAAETRWGKKKAVKKAGKKK
jgi:hypothetical protein